MKRLRSMGDAERSTYASRWARIGAHLIDGAILIPITLASFYLERWGLGPAVALAVGLGVVHLAYHVVFLAILGATPGKLALGIRVATLGGTRIGWREAALRFSVDGLLEALSVVAAVLAPPRPRLARLPVTRFHGAARKPSLRPLPRGRERWVSRTGCGSGERSRRSFSTGDAARCTISSPAPSSSEGSTCADRAPRSRDDRTTRSETRSSSAVNPRRPCGEASARVAVPSRAAATRAAPPSGSGSLQIRGRNCDGPELRGREAAIGRAPPPLSFPTRTYALIPPGPPPRRDERTPRSPRPGPPCCRSRIASSAVTPGTLARSAETRRADP